LILIAKSLGGEVEKAFPWNDFKELLIYGVKGVFDAQRGDVFGLPFDQSWTRLLQKGGWWTSSYKTFDAFWEKLLERGGWWDPIYDFMEWGRIFQTPSKKFEFYAQGLRGIQSPSGFSESTDTSLLPHSEEPAGKAREEDYPFSLHTFKTLSLGGTRNANQPWLQAIAGPNLFERWGTWMEIHPETASRLGISDGDWVWVESPEGKIKVKARHYKGAMPDVVNIPFGGGHRSRGRWSKGLGENPYRILRTDLDPLTGYPINGSTRVKVYKA
jgi:anaerobic selenocysteine-containing dehydrogenase